MTFFSNKDISVLIVYEFRQGKQKLITAGYPGECMVENLLSMGLDIETVAKAADLPVEEIMALQKASFKLGGK